MILILLSQLTPSCGWKCRLGEGKTMEGQGAGFSRQSECSPSQTREMQISCFKGKPQSKYLLPIEMH